MHLRICLKHTGTWVQGTNAKDVKLFLSGETLKSVTVECGFAVTTSLVLNWTLIALLSL